MEIKKHKIGILSADNPFDRRVSSGTRFMMAEQLEQRGYEVVWIKIILPKMYMWRFLLLCIAKITGKTYLYRKTTRYCLKYVKTANKTLIESCDVLMVAFFSGVCYGLATTKNILYFSDSTFNLLDGYYYKNLSSWSRQQGNLIEQTALDKATHIIVSSQWTKESVIKDYKISQSKVSVVEFGPNLDECDIVDKTFVFNGELHILFLGVDWQRKGGELALAAVRWLNNNGVNTILHIVGIKDLSEDIRKNPYVKNHGFMDKNVKPEYRRLVEIIQMSHCLLLPTKAECAGIVFCEASANGLPSFSHKTGGIPNYVINGENGYLLPVGASGEDFGRKIKECLLSGEMERMSETAKLVYKEKLNWNTWGDSVQNIIESL